MIQVANIYAPVSRRLLSDTVLMPVHHLYLNILPSTLYQDFPMGFLIPNRSFISLIKVGQREFAVRSGPQFPVSSRVETQSVWSVSQWHNCGFRGVQRPYMMIS